VRISNGGVFPAIFIMGMQDVETVFNARAIVIAAMKKWTSEAELQVLGLK
jgi:hypothetical protein